jgi:hypothetical protein
VALPGSFSRPWLGCKLPLTRPHRTHASILGVPNTRSSACQAPAPSRHLASVHQGPVAAACRKLRTASEARGR